MRPIGHLTGTGRYGRTGEYAAHAILASTGHSPAPALSAYDSSADGFRAFRRRLGLPVPEGWNIIDARLSPHRNLGLAPTAYVPVKEGWPSNYELTGFSNWSGPDDGRLPEDVIEFLDTGEPPVIVTLGTSGASARPELFEQAATALDAEGARGLFLVSTSENVTRLRAAGLSPAHGAWPFVPLAPLLPRSRGIVHSGAHGTNALALAAGVPSVVIPCLFDQLWHARRQAELGTGVWVRRPRRLERGTSPPADGRVAAGRGRGAGPRHRSAGGHADGGGPDRGVPPGRLTSFGRRTPSGGVRSERVEEHQRGHADDQRERDALRLPRHRRSRGGPRRDGAGGGRSGPRGARTPG